MARGGGGGGKGPGRSLGTHVDPPEQSGTTPSPRLRTSGSPVAARAPSTRKAVSTEHLFKAPCPHWLGLARWGWAAGTRQVDSPEPLDGPGGGGVGCVPPTWTHTVSFPPRATRPRHIAPPPFVTLPCTASPTPLWPAASNRHADVCCALVSLEAHGPTAPGAHPSRTPPDTHATPTLLPVSPTALAEVTGCPGHSRSPHPWGLMVCGRPPQL